MLDKLKWLLWPLRSRKAQVAIATLITAYLAQAGLEIDENSVGYIIAVGITWIITIMGEDIAAKARPADPPAGENKPQPPQN